MDLFPTFPRKPTFHNPSSTRRPIRPQTLSKAQYHSSPATPLAIPSSQQNRVPIPKASPPRRAGSPDMLFDMSPPSHSPVHGDTSPKQKSDISGVAPQKTSRKEYDCESKGGLLPQRFYTTSFKRTNSSSTNTVSAATSRGRPRISIGSGADACYDPAAPYIGVGLGLIGGGFDMDENIALDKEAMKDGSEPFMYSFPMPSKKTKPLPTPKLRHTPMPTLYSQTRSPSPPFGPTSRTSTANTTPRSASSSSSSRSPVPSRQSSRSSLADEAESNGELTSAFRLPSSPSPYPSPSSLSSSPSPSTLNLFSNATSERPASDQRSKSRTGMTWIGRSVAFGRQRTRSRGGNSVKAESVLGDVERGTSKAGDVPKGRPDVETTIRREVSKDLDGAVTVHVAEVLGQPKLAYPPQIAGPGMALQRGRSRAPRVRRGET